MIANSLTTSTYSSSSLSSICQSGDDIDDNNSEHDELTNLEWLTELKNLSNWPGCGDVIDMDANNIDNDANDVQISGKKITEERFNKFMLQVKQSQLVYAQRMDIYRLNEHEKPPFNYAIIIALAMMDNGKMTLKDICKWIEERFAYFRCSDNWNNSIRHNLSLHFCFTKVPRGKYEKGKGGYWQLSLNANKSERKRIRNRKKRPSAIGKNSRVAALLLSSSSSSSSSSSTSSVTDDVLSSKISMNIIEAAATKAAIDSTTNVSPYTNETFAKMSDDDETKYHMNDNDDDDCGGKQTAYILDAIVVDQMIVDNVTSHIEIQQQQQLYLNISSMENIENHHHQEIVAVERVLKDQQTYIDVPDFSQQLAPINDGSNEIFVGCDLPSSCDNGILRPLLKMNQQNIEPNVIVEPMPYTLSDIDTALAINEEFTNLSNELFDFTNW